MAREIGDVKKFMYHVGDLIIYGCHGVCRVDAVGIPDIPGIGKNRIYYTLFPLYNNGKIFAPVDSGIFMRSVITYAETQKIISLIPSIREYDYNNTDIKLLEDNYKKSLQTNDCTNLIKVIKTIYSKKVTTEVQGKKLGQIDENFMKRAEDLLYGEFAVTLNMPKEKVKSYIEDEVKKIETGSYEE
jgi:CarD family transcriptional regulator